MAASPAAPAASLDIANQLRPVLLHLNRHLRREAQSLGVSAGQISILSAIQDRPGIGVADLAVREGTSSPSICTHVDRLESAGFVTRTRESEGDRRRVGLTVTAAGTKLLRTVRSRRTAWLASRLDALQPEERERVAAAIIPLTSLVGRS
jgi:DNA-binding MarR family transcriptional regulator